MEQNNKSAFATAALVLGIVAIVLSVLFIFNFISMVCAALSIIFAIIALSNKQSVKKSVWGLVLSGISIVISVALTVVTYAASLGFVGNVFGKIFGYDGSIFEEFEGGEFDFNELILGDYDDIYDRFNGEDDCTVEFGEIEFVGEGDHMRVKLPVKITNITEEMKSFSVTVEAVNPDGSRVETDTLYAESLRAGQSQTLYAFEFAEGFNVENLKTATFNILTVESYDW